ncbi:DinB family protein [Micromonospora sp. DR5-3]|uniref:DinB family protein n=1 Tax=unclassified Micromonospora TaxID=2617518 RepID=UPI0011D51694|nr:MULTISPECIES: DinB family protein [unclassified Micromonospora]MCW3814175.1 DinB family protein [Micromonospora sp. DR5-3]TYC25058.1 DinB family protein [Micromonospora sp. MP36]
MADTTIDPTFGPVLARTGDERAVLESFLDFHRAIVLRKVRGLSDADASRRLVPSLTTLAGLLKHLALVERNWLPCLFAPEPGDVYLTSEEEAVASFTLEPGETVAALAAAYQAACARSRAVAARFALDHVVPHPQLGEVSLRWVLVHLIEETARHAGHADILRELTDGETGAI